MQTVFEARDINEAHIVAGMLEAEGIRAHVCGHFLQGGVGELAGLDFARVQVDVGDLPRAQTVVATYAPQPSAPSAQESKATDLWPELRQILILLGLGALLLLGLLYAV